MSIVLSVLNDGAAGIDRTPALRLYAGAGFGATEHPYAYERARVFTKDHRPYDGVPAPA